jgi:hypothetical protein
MISPTRHSDAVCGAGFFHVVCSNLTSVVLHPKLLVMRASSKLLLLALQAGCLHEYDECRTARRGCFLVGCIAYLRLPSLFVTMLALQGVDCHQVAQHCCNGVVALANTGCCCTVRAPSSCDVNTARADDH